MSSSRKAAATYEKMEARRERKIKERSDRRLAAKAGTTGHPPGWKGGRAPRVQTKDGSNPFTKEREARSNFNVNSIRRVEFVGSFVEDEAAWPKTHLPEIAFLGRSNVGKSSMLNTLFGESVAKVSKTPGRTRQINIFKAKNERNKEICYFADLPGYGYAKMSKDKQRNVETFLEKYLARRSNLKLLILLVDSRREPLESDLAIAEYVAQGGSRFKLLVVSTKVDKLNAMETFVNIKRLREAFELPEDLPVMFSATSGKGKNDVWAYIKEAARM